MEYLDFLRNDFGLLAHLPKDFRLVVLAEIILEDEKEFEPLVSQMGETVWKEKDQGETGIIRALNFQTQGEERRGNLGPFLPQHLS